MAVVTCGVAEIYVAIGDSYWRCVSCHLLFSKLTSIDEHVRQKHGDDFVSSRSSNSQDQRSTSTQVSDTQTLESINTRVSDSLPLQSSNRCGSDSQSRQSVITRVSDSQSLQSVITRVSDSQSLQSLYSSHRAVEPSSPVPAVVKIDLDEPEELAIVQVRNKDGKPNSRSSRSSDVDENDIDEDDGGVSKAMVASMLSLLERGLEMDDLSSVIQNLDSLSPESLEQQLLNQGDLSDSFVDSLNSELDQLFKEGNVDVQTQQSSDSRSHETGKSEQNEDLSGNTTVVTDLIKVDRLTSGDIVDTSSVLTPGCQDVSATKPCPPLNVGNMKEGSGDGGSDIEEDLSVADGDESAEEEVDNEDVMDQLWVTNNSGALKAMKSFMKFSSTQSKIFDLMSSYFFEEETCDSKVRPKCLSCEDNTQSSTNEADRMFNNVVSLSVTSSPQARDESVFTSTTQPQIDKQDKPSMTVDQGSVYISPSNCEETGDQGGQSNAINTSLAPVSDQAGNGPIYSVRLLNMVGASLLKNEESESSDLFKQEQGMDGTIVQISSDSNNVVKQLNNGQLQVCSTQHSTDSDSLVKQSNCGQLQETIKPEKLQGDKSQNKGIDDQGNTSVQKIDRPKTNSRKQHPVGLQVSFQTLKFSSNQDTERRNKQRRLKAARSTLSACDTEEGTQQSLMCKVCDKTFDCTGSLQRHLRVNLSSADSITELSTCKVCGRKFHSLSLLNVHMIWRHSKTLRLLKCVVCNLNCSSFAFFVQHARIHQKEEAEKTLKSHTKSSVGSKSKYLCKFSRCRKCSSIILNKPQAIKTHKCKKPSCMICNLEFATQSMFKIHMATHEGRMFECEICGERFRNKQIKKRHHLLSHSNRKHLCQVCGKLFSRKSDLRRHTDFHFKIKRNQTLRCTDCNKVYKTVRSMKHHMNMHLGVNDKKFKCSKCGHQFLYSWQLRDHLSWHHFGEKPLHCDYCGKGFVCRPTLVRHMSKEHTNNRPHKCRYCPQAFIEKKKLDVHEAKEHTQVFAYPCQQCGKGFVRLADLKQHSRVHTKERPHQCHLCGKTFTKISHVKRHLESCVRMQAAKSLTINMSHDVSNGTDSVSDNHRKQEDVEVTTGSMSEPTVGECASVVGSSFHHPVLFVQPLLPSLPVVTHPYFPQFQS